MTLTKILYCFKCDTKDEVFIPFSNFFYLFNASQHWFYRNNHPKIGEEPRTRPENKKANYSEIGWTPIFFHTSSPPISISNFKFTLFQFDWNICWDRSKLLPIPVLVYSYGFFFLVAFKHGCIQIVVILINYHTTVISDLDNVISNYNWESFLFWNAFSQQI